MESIILIVIAIGVWLFFRSRANNSKKKLNYLMVGQHCFNRDDWQGAIQGFTKYLEDVPTNELKGKVSVYNLRAAAFEKIGKSHLALADLIKSIELDPNQLDHLYIRNMIEVYRDKDN